MSNVRSVDRIISAKDYGGGAKNYIRKWQQRQKQRGISVFIRGLDEPPRGLPLPAVIWQGQWIVRTNCCNSASFVDPDEPIFVCGTCANRANDNRPRPVTFPPEAERKEIERLLLERPVNDVAGLTDMERAGLAQPVLFVEVIEPNPDTLVLPTNNPDYQTVKNYKPLVRSWEGESVDALRAEQAEPIRKWQRELMNPKASLGDEHGIQ